MRRVIPAFALFLLSPFVAEFLLGDFGLDTLYVFVGLAPMYGAAAILIREVTRRAGRGWPTMVVLAVAYGVLEEGLVTMSLFNPDYAHAHLLDTGFVPALGIAVPWTIFVVGIHTIWSMSIPILTVEGFTGRRETPWLRTPGLIVTVVVFVLGSILDTVINWSNGHYVASWPHLLGAAIMVVVLVVGAFRIPVPSPSRVVAPVPWLVFVAVVVLGLLFLGGLSDGVAVWLGVAMQVVAIAVAVVVIGGWSRRDGWGDWSRFAIAAAGLFLYAGHSFFSTPLLGGGPVITPVSHVVFTLVVLVVLGLEARTIRRREPVSRETVSAVGDR